MYFKNFKVGFFFKFSCPLFQHLYFDKKVQVFRTSYLENQIMDRHALWPKTFYLVPSDLSKN